MEIPSFSSSTLVGIPRKQCVIASIKVLKEFVKSKSATTGNLQVHFPVKNLPLQLERKEETFYEILYDTNQFQVLPKRWLWKRNGVWILKVDDVY